MYPITYEADFNPTPGRGTTFFRWLLAIPWFIVAMFWGILYGYITHILAVILVLILGRYPRWLYRFNAGVIRFGVRFSAWFYLQTDEWPPFGLADDREYPIRVNIPEEPEERQSRLKALFRVILVFPMLIVAYGVAFLGLGAAFVAWMAIVFRGYLPEGINQAMTYMHSFNARVGGYNAILTDEYPPIGLEVAGAGDVAPAPPAPPVPPQPPAQPAA